MPMHGPMGDPHGLGMGGAVGPAGPGVIPGGGGPAMGPPPPPGMAPPGGLGALPPSAREGAQVQVMMADGAPVQGVIVATDPELGLIHVQVGPMAQGAGLPGPGPGPGMGTPAGGSLESVLAGLGGGLR